MRRLRLLLALCVCFASAATLSACGGDSVPGNAVAKVADTSIPVSEFQHWLKIAATSAQSQVPGQATGPAAVPDPPDFKACIAQKRRTAPKPARGQPAPTDAQFKAQCQQEYVGLRDQVMQFLITARWFEGEAGDQGLEVTDKQVQQQFARTRQQQFPTPQAFQRFLKQSGYTQADILFRVRLGLIQNKLRDRIVRGRSNASPAQVAAYYNRNKQQFGQPERRDIQLILTKDKGTADKAKAELDGGAKFADVAKRYSTDPQTKGTGGVLMGATKSGGQLEPQLALAVFAAPVNKLTGPLQTQYGWYIFNVQKITPGSQQTLQQATPTIKQILASQNQQKALDAFIKGFRKKWTDQTVCRKGYITQNCKNAPKPKQGASTTRTGG